MYTIGVHGSFGTGVRQVTVGTEHWLGAMLSFQRGLGFRVWGQRAGLVAPYYRGLNTYLCYFGDSS